MKIQSITINTKMNQYSAQNLNNKLNNVCFKAEEDDDTYVKIPKKKYQRDKAIEWGIIIVLIVIEAIRAFSRK